MPAFASKVISSAVARLKVLVNKSPVSVSNELAPVGPKPALSLLPKPGLLGSVISGMSWLSAELPFLSLSNNL